MDCQLESLPAAGNEPSPGEGLRWRAHHALLRLARRTRRAAAEPRLLLEKAHLVARQERPSLRGGPNPVVPAPLRLAPGERVRVKPLEAILATLDEVGDCEGLGFMPVQAWFCGKEFAVRRRVERFFDERTRRMLRIRNTVILDGVYCEPPVGGDDDYSGCQRSCFLFWKEAWLERL
jgi:hypothetical protein